MKKVYVGLSLVDRIPPQKLIAQKKNCNFSTVGAPIGAVTGALIGLVTETGLVRRAVIGAISGVVFSIECVESSVVLWHSHESGIWSILYVVSLNHAKQIISRNLNFLILVFLGPKHLFKLLELAAIDPSLIFFLLQIDIIYSLLSGRLVREKIGPAVQSAVQSQVVVELD